MSDVLCMCGTKARRAYDADGNKLPRCARCGDQWVEREESADRGSAPDRNWEEYEEFRRQQGRAAPRRTTLTGPDWLCLGIWAIAFIPILFAIYYFINAQGDDEYALRSGLGVVATETIAIIVMSTGTAHVITQAIKAIRGE